MRLVKFCIKGFRNYRDSSCIELDNLTAIIGKNDAGKSTILEAMDTYFNGTKLDSGDYTIGGTTEIRLTAYFGDLPEAIIIDEANPISLQNEYLLNKEGLLAVEKVYKGASPAHKETYIIANHPSTDNVKDLLTLKITELRQRAQSLGVDLSDVNGTIKSVIRQRIWSECVDLDLTEQKILIKDEDTKKIADKLEAYMPAYSLFKSDRPSTDQDEEAQDPMQAAIKEAMKAQEEVLNEIAAVVEREVRAIADQTVAKLRTMDIDLASELTPVFKTDWSKVFKLSLTSDDAIPLNKRGSGVRRLVLLNFFRVKAEQKRSVSHAMNTIYAIEEPETSQHPDKQKLLMEAFLTLSEDLRSQVIFTTHTPMLASLLDESKIRYVKNRTIINDVTEEDKREIAKNLGVLPDNNVKVFIGVEGVNDINFMKNISKIINAYNPEVANLEHLEKDGTIVFVPLGGSSFKLWINRLNGLNKSEIHICDRDNEPPQPSHYQDIVDAINSQENKQAFVTTKRELENYIHHDAIMTMYASDVEGLALNAFEAFDNVPELVARAINELSETSNPWDEQSSENRKSKESKVKKRLNEKAVLLMDERMYSEVDPEGEILVWLKAIKDAIEEE
jgi:predicted ATP-dependent endonuclease of OLD family